MLFITDSAPTTARSYAELRRRLPQTTFVPVHNEAASFMFMPQDFPPTRPECGFIRIPRLSPIVRGVIEKHHGQILVAKKWDERKLSYEIGKAKRGLFIIAYFNAPGADVTPLERDVKLSEDFIRVLVTRADHLSLKEMEAVEPQPIAPPQPERAPWDAPSAMDFSGPPSGPRGPRSGGGGKRREEAGVEMGKE